MSGDAYKYWAFISYSHQDRAWGDWLHKTLETYRVPSRLVGRESRDGTIPRRLYPVFRDRDELPSSANLGDALNESLRQSRYQIVICSPRAAASRWVNEEVKYFKSLGREDRVLCLIVAGEPNVFDLPGHDIEECFCPALRYPAEPIAADARDHADGKTGAKLKLVAGLVGVGLDELIQRERQRQLWKNVQVAAAAMAFAGLCIGAWQWYVGKTAAREREITIERIVETGRQEFLAGHQARAAVLLNQAYSMGHDTVALRYLLAQAMKPVEALTGVRVKHDGYGVYRSPVFSPDGKYFVLGARNKDDEQVAVARLHEASTGKLIRELSGAVSLTVSSRFFAAGKRFLQSGFPDERAGGAPLTVLWNLDGAATPVRIAGFNGVTGEAVSLDGKRVLISRADGLAIHDTDTGQVIATFAKDRSITAASYSPDGNSIAIADGKGMVELLAAVDGKRLRLLPEATGQTIAGILYSPDGQRVLAASAAGDVHIWDATTGLLQVAFAVDPNQLSGLQFDRDGNRLLTIGLEGFKVWSTRRGSLLFSIPTTLNNLAAASLSPDGNTLMVADSRSNVAEAWDVRAKNKLFALDLHRNGVTGVAFDADGKRLLLAGRDGEAEIWRMPVTPAWKYDSFTTLPFVARFTADGRHLLAAGGGYTDGSALLFDLEAGTLARTYAGHKALIYDVRFGSADARFLTASADGSAGVWDAKSGERLATLDHAPNEVFGVQSSADGRRILTSTLPEGPSRKDAAGLWDAGTLQRIAWLEHDDVLRAARFDRAGDRIATAGRDKLVKLWASSDGTLLRTLSGHTAWVNSVEFSSDGRTLLTAAEDNTVRVWDVHTGQVLHKLDDAGLGVPTQAAYAPDGQTIAIATEAGTIWLWQPGAGSPRALKGHEQQVRGVRFSGDGALLFSYSYDGTSRAWDVRSGSALGLVTAHDRMLNDLEVSTDSSRLVTSSWGQLQVADIGLERRTASELAAILACQTPWVFDEVRSSLTPAAPDPSRCLHHK